MAPEEHSSCEHVFPGWLPHAAATLQWSLSASSPDFDNAPQAQADGAYGHWQLTIDQVGSTGHRATGMVDTASTVYSTTLFMGQGHCRVPERQLGFLSAGTLLLILCDARLLGGLLGFCCSVHTHVLNGAHRPHQLTALCIRALLSSAVLCCAAVCRRSPSCQLPAARSPSFSLREMHHTHKKSA